MLTIQCQLDDKYNVCDNLCPIAATGIQNNFIPNEHGFVTPEQEINKASHDVIPKRKGRPKQSGFKGTPTKKETTINSVIRVVEDNFQENIITHESSTQISHNNTAGVSTPLGFINHANATMPFVAYNFDTCLCTDNLVL